MGSAAAGSLARLPVGNVDSDFNGGNTDSDGWTIAPYAAVILNDIFSVDVSGGITQVDYDQDFFGRCPPLLEFGRADQAIEDSFEFGGGRGIFFKLS